MASPTGLLSLPPELTTDICQILTLHPTEDLSSNNFKQLSFFSQTCKQVNQVATPVLYSRFTATPAILVTLRFLSSLCRRPELGEFVRQLSFKFTTNGTLATKHLDMYSEAAARLGVELGEWPRQSPYETLTQLIIGHTPNVRTIEVFSDRFMASRASVPTVLEQLAKGVPTRISLLRLEKLTVNYLYATGLPIEHYAALFALAPGLRHLVVQPSSPLHYPWTQPKDRLSLGSVSRLTLQLGSLTRNQMEAVVYSCGPLELFEHTYSTTTFEREPSVTPAEMIQILERHADTLSTLSLSLAWRNRESSTTSYDLPLCMEGDEIRSLKAFSRLQDVLLDGSCFIFPAKNDTYYHTYVFTQLLPESIRKFRITLALPGTVENLQTLVKSRSEFPHLAEVRMENKFVSPESFLVWQDVTALERLMQMAGILFSQDCPLLGVPPSSESSPRSEYVTYALWPRDAASSQGAFRPHFRDLISGFSELNVDASDVEGSGGNESDLYGPGDDEFDADTAQERVMTGSADTEEVWD